MPEPYTADRAAGLLQVSRDTVLRAIANGRLAATRDATGRHLITPVDLIAYVADTTVRPDGQEIAMSPTDLAEFRTYTLEEVSDQTGLSVWWLRDKTRRSPGKQPELVHCRPGRQVRMTREQIAAAVAYSHSQNSPTGDAEVAAEIARRTRRGRGRAA